MKKIRLLGVLCCFLWMGTADLWAGKPTRLADTVKMLQLAQWKERPHNIQLGYGLSVYSYYSYDNRKPLSRFVIDYAYDLRWKHIRTNFFVTGNVSYSGYLCNRKHYDVNQFHVSAGIGFNIHLTHFLNLSFAYSPGFTYEENVTCSLDKPVNSGNHKYSSKEIIYAYRSLFSIRLTGEVKNVRIGIGLENPNFVIPLITPHYFLSLNVGYRF